MVRPMARITLDRPDLATLEARWRDLEARSDLSFFQSWSWVGRRLAERFPDPLLLAAEAHGRTLALALFNRAPDGRLWLHESGDPTWDTVFIEHNGPLIARDAPADLAARLEAALDGTVVWSGIDATQAARLLARPGTIRRKEEQPAPRLDFAPIRAAARGWEAELSANTRQQLRRSLRRYAEGGALAIHAAASAGEAIGFLADLARLHQATWEGRGQPGAFAEPRFLDFHRDLITHALPRGEVALLRVTAGDEIVGYLYNFLWRGWSLAYQSGFAYPDGDSHRKPGLTCHHLAISAHFDAGGAGYDFLAGDARYKTSLANDARTLHWLETGPAWRPAALRARLAGWIKGG